MRLFIQKSRLSVTELTVFAMLGAMMYLSRFIMQALPSVHLLAMFIAAFTLTYRAKALIPIYLYVLIEGVTSGFSLWWYPYLYIWLPLWAIVMFVSRIEMPRKVQIPVYMIVCGFHGFSFGTMYAPMQALMFGLNFEAMIAWIIAGLPFDITQGCSNLLIASLVIPLHTLMKNLSKNI